MARTEATASWGVGVSSPVPGDNVIVEYSEASEAILGTEQNEEGAVIGQKMYDRHWTATATVQAAAGVEPPAIGSQVTANGEAWYVKSAEVVESNTNYRRIRMTLERYEHCNSTH